MQPTRPSLDSIFGPIKSGEAQNRPSLDQIFSNPPQIPPEESAPENKTPLLTDESGGFGHSLGTAAKDVAMGAGKSFIRGTRDVAGGIQSLGKATAGLFGVDTSNPNDEIRSIDNNTSQGSQVNDQLQSKSTGEQVGGALETIGELGAGLVTKGPEAITKATQAYDAYKEAKVGKDALEVVTPKLSKLETEKALAEGRGETKGLLRKTTIAPDKRLLDVADATKGIVKKGASGAENINAVKTALNHEAESLKAQIKTVDHPYSFKELNAKLSNIEEPISLKGTPFEKQIGAVKQAAMDIAKKKGGNISSLLDSRKEFDALVSKEYPNLYDKENAPMRNAITGIRNAMNDFIEKNLPEGNQYRDSLKKQSLYYDAIDNIAGKSTGEVGTSKIGRALKVVKDHPVGSLIGAGVVDKAIKATTGLGF